MKFIRFEYCDNKYEKISQGYLFTCALYDVIEGFLIKGKYNTYTHTSSKYIHT